MTDLHPALIAARRNVANGKIVAFDNECWRLAQLVRVGVLGHQIVVNVLQDIADANNLTDIFGVDHIQALMAGAFALKTETPEVAA